MPRLRLFLLCGLAVAFAAPMAPRAAPEGPTLRLPLACEIGRTCEVQHYVDRDPGPGVLDYRCGHRTNDKHDGIDFRLTDTAAQRAGVDVLGAAAGRVIAVRDGVPDISIRAPGAPSVAGHECGNRVGIALGGGWIIDYCHLAKGSLRVKVGDVVAAGQALAHVGFSGDTEFPHLHFSVRHDNAVVDPFAPDPITLGACAPQTPLWSPEVARALPYKPGVVLNAGLAGAAVTQGAIEDRTQIQASAASANLVAYARFIGLEAGDVIEIAVSGPGGARLASGVTLPLDHDKAEWLTQLGAKRPPGGWPHGTYGADIRVRRAGAEPIRTSLKIGL
jgi:hypothetical protein